MAAFSTDSRECIKVLSADGILMHVNNTGLELLEAPSIHDLSGTRYTDIWPVDSRDRVARAIRTAADGTHATLEGYCPTFVGTPRWWETTFYRDHIRGGRDTVIIGVSRDISAQRGNALAAHALLERFSQLAAARAEGVLGISGEGACAYCNTAAALLLGCTRGALTGRPLHSLLHDPRLHDPRSGVAAPAITPKRPLLSAARSPRPSHIDYEHFLHENGRAIPVVCDAYPVSAVAHQYRSIVIFRERNHQSSDTADEASATAEFNALLTALNQL